MYSGWGEFFDKEEPYNVFHPTIFAQPEEPVEYYLDAGPANANKLFWMVGSLSGTEPGFIYDQGLPYPNIHFPLNLVGFIPGTPPKLDPYLSATLSANPGTFVSEFPHIGQFDGLGRAVVKFQLPALTMSLLYGAEVK